MDALFVGGLVVSMDPSVRGADGELGVVEDGAVGVSGGELAYVGPADGVDPSAADEVIDAEGCAVLPGFVDAHAHTKYALLRGAAQDLPEIEWMNDGLGPFAARTTPADDIAGCQLGAVEALAAGTTTVCEYAGDVGRLASAAYAPLGVRVVAAELITEVPTDRSGADPDEPYPFDRSKGESALARAEALFDDFDDDPLVTPAYGPQALDMVSPELLEEIDRRSRERGARVHVHVAQGDRERRQVEARYGADESTVSVLDDLGLLSERLVAAHLHGATPAERERLADAGASMVGCPSSIAAIDGVAPPIAEYLDHGGTVGVGTDQAPGPGGHDLRRELRTASLLSKVDRADPTALPAWEALRLGTLGGARALGIDDEVGSLTEGKRADVVVVDLGRPNLAPTVTEPLRTAIPNLVYGAGGGEVRDVFVDGRALLRGGSFVDVDPEAVVREANERAARVFREGADGWREAGSKLVGDADSGRL